jgi:hypothetical protein
MQGFFCFTVIAALENSLNLCIRQTAHNE